MNRKHFLKNASILSAGALLWSDQVYASNNQNYTVQDIINILVAEAKGVHLPTTVDTIKFGNAASPVTGIVTTMFPTVEVIKQAAALKANLIVVHEPTYFNGDDKKNLISNNTVIKDKDALLEKEGITIFRYHDYCHRINPDAITYGLLRKFGWLDYYKNGKFVFEIPTMELKALAKHCKKSLQLKMLRYIGADSHKCTKIAVMPGAWGAIPHMSTIEKEQPDLLIIGEGVEWETVEYIRDGLALNHKTALVILGHSVSEEPGMEWVSEWLQKKVPTLKVTHIASQDPFTWL